MMPLPPNMSGIYMSATGRQLSVMSAEQFEEFVANLGFRYVTGSSVSFDQGIWSIIIAPYTPVLLLEEANRKCSARQIVFHPIPQATYHDTKVKSDVININLNA